MNACIFAGPTLPPNDPERTTDVIWLPPVRHGDVFLAVMDLRPRAIGIIDGFFQWAAAVWHKELLWAMHSGVHVFGAASMGALRAAELAPFGMRGIGAIFEAYSNGSFEACGAHIFEDDDEVAVVHGPEESGYLAASEAMVNIRCTLERAYQERVITSRVRQQLEAIAKGVFFADRTYSAILRLARDTGLPRAMLCDFETWLAQGRIDQKRADALAMVKAMREFLAGDPAPAQANFVFEHTLAWDRAVQALQAQSSRSSEDVLVLTELRLEDTRFLAFRREVLDALAHPSDGSRPDPGTHATLPDYVMERQILARARAAGDYERLLARGLGKKACLANHPDVPRASDFPGWKLLDLRDWFFSRVRQTDMPDDLDDYLAQLGYSDESGFHDALLAEFVYRRDGG